MEEKKITDEEIAKAILQSIEYSKTITYFDEWGNCKAIMMADVIDLIHRLHSENTEQKAEIERLTEERENMQAEIIATEESRLQAVKSTAKEIFQIAVDFYDGKDINGDLFLGTLRERYGVEVE